MNLHEEKICIKIVAHKATHYFVVAKDLKIFRVSKYCFKFIDFKF
jgi:hypothetical protein